MIAAPKVADAPSQTECRSLADPLVAILNELRVVLQSLSPAQYTAKMGDVFSNAHVGGHLRHCLDHVRAVVDGREAGVIDYDHRERGTPIEADLNAATLELARLAGAAALLRTLRADERVDVAVMPTRDGVSLRLRSTIGRELAFVLSHTIHHNALVRGMVVSMGLPVPASFGYAPSTLAHQDHA